MPSGKLYSLAKMNTATTGTGTITLSTVASGFITFAQAGVSNGETVTYCIEDGANREVGYGVYTSSGTTLTRNVLRSTNSNNAINLSGTAAVGITAAAENFTEWFANIDANGFSIGFDDNTGVNDDSGNEVVRFRKTSSAVNYVEILNTATGTGPQISAAGDDTNINLRLAGKGTGELEWNSKISTPRERLLASRTYYVRTDGSDSNTGLANTSGSAFLTIQKAIDTVASLDCSIYDVSISVADGTYTGANTLKKIIGAGRVTITGNTTTPANVLISVTSNGCFTADNVGLWAIEGVKCTTTTSGSLIVVQGASSVQLGKNDYGTCAGPHQIHVVQGGFVDITAGYNISGQSTFAHMTSGFYGTLQNYSKASTFSANVTFTYFAYATGLGSINSGSSTWTSSPPATYSVTAQRYLANVNSYIFTNGGGASYFPGNVAGATATGGVYA